MGILRIDCPWCKIANSAFTIAAERGYRTANFDHIKQFTVGCGGCGKWALFEGKVSQRDFDIEFATFDFEIDLSAFWDVRVLPEGPSTDAPEHTDPAVARPFIQALRALHRADWDAAGVMARKALDVATYLVDPALQKGSKLVKRIDTLAAAHKITPQLQEWAHAIREDGNEAAHGDDEFSEQEARDICEFTRTFLEYVFTMPAQLAARKAAVQGGNP